MPTALSYETITGQLSIADNLGNQVEMRGPTWSILDLRVLIFNSAARRGQDRRMPQCTGVRPYPRRRDVTTWSLPFVVAGYSDENGVPIGPCTDLEYLIQLELNIAWLEENIAAPAFTDDGTRASILTCPSGEVRTADIHVLGMDFDPIRGIVRTIGGRFDISIPQGRFVA